MILPPRLGRRSSSKDPRPALTDAPGDAARSRHKPAGTLQVAAYDSFSILRPVGEIDLVVLVTQAWVCPARQPFTIQPSKDPNRCEILVISALDGVTKEQKLLLYACIREPNGVLTDLKPLPVPAYLKVEGPLLRAFLIGYRLAMVASLPTP